MSFQEKSDNLRDHVPGVKMVHFKRTTLKALDGEWSYKAYVNHRRGKNSFVIF